jgi:ribonuclease HI
MFRKPWSLVAGRGQLRPTGEPSDTGGEAHTTNQRMEIMAAMEALRAHVDHEGPIEIRSDSTYVVHCFRDASWHVGWKKRGWKNSQRQPVANRDLWEPLIEMVLARGDVTFTWVKAHNGEQMNELVDALGSCGIHWLQDEIARVARFRHDRCGCVVLTYGSQWNKRNRYWRSIGNW